MHRSTVSNQGFRRFMRLDRMTWRFWLGRRADKHDREFLPAALEIMETPPSPIGRGISLTIIAIFCLALTWAFLGKIDIVASASGKIVPSGRTKIVQPFETGVVRRLHVRDGERVRKGD